MGCCQEGGRRSTQAQSPHRCWKGRSRRAARACELSREDWLPLEATPASLRETAVDGTPRSAKAAGAQLRRLTQSFYERLLDPRFYGFSHEELEQVEVRTFQWSKFSEWVEGVAR